MYHVADWKHNSEHTIYPLGGIGRRAWFRSRFLRKCEFESRGGYVILRVISLTKTLVRQYAIIICSITPMRYDAIAKQPSGSLVKGKGDTLSPVKVNSYTTVSWVFPMIRGMPNYWTSCEEGLLLTSPSVRTLEQGLSEAVCLIVR